MARVCLMCGDAAAGKRMTCWGCGARHLKEGARAMAAVNQAVAKGALRRASEHACTDCGARATEYDHRDYTQPLAVEPVCAACNKRRGPAFNSIWRPTAEVA